MKKFQRKTPHRLGNLPLRYPLRSSFAKGYGRTSKATRVKKSFGGTQYKLIRIYDSDASVGAPTEASGMNTNHLIFR